MIISYSSNHKMNIHKIRNTLAHTIGIWFKIKLPIPLRCDIWSPDEQKQFDQIHANQKHWTKFLVLQIKIDGNCARMQSTSVSMPNERHNSLQRLFFAIFSFTTVVDYKIETKLGIWEYLFFSFFYLLHQSNTLNALHTHTFTIRMDCDRKSVKYCSVWVRL